MKSNKCIVEWFSFLLFVYSVFSYRAGWWQNLRHPSDGHHGGRSAHARRQQFVSDASGRGCGGSLHAAVTVDDVCQVLLHGTVRFTDRGLHHAVLQLSRQRQMITIIHRAGHDRGISVYNICGYLKSGVYPYKPRGLYKCNERSLWPA